MKKVCVNASLSYEILIERGILNRTGEFARAVFANCKNLQNIKVAIVTDDTVAGLYLSCVKDSMQKAGFNICSFIFPHGEDSKSHDTLLNLYDFLIAEELTRTDFILALGGGVVGDLAGYAASTYLRGVPFMQVPTTFLAAVDSSVGGKTAVNRPAGKNLIGTFWQPSLVLCDPDTFNSLEPDTFADGAAEMIKYGLIYDKAFFTLLENGDIYADLESVIAKCVDIKRQIVEKDEHDTGLRMILNFGHTLAHSIEKVTNHKITHGHAVAIGMVLIATIGERLNINSHDVTARIISCLEKYNLPTSYSGELEELAAACLCDKKRVGGKINLIFVPQIGETIIKLVDTNDFQKMLSPVCIPAPVSKSDLHRLLIAAALSSGQTVIHITKKSGGALPEDIKATSRVLCAMGAEISFLDDAIFVHGISEKPSNLLDLDCGESGSTLRFMLSIVAAMGLEACFRGSGRLPFRPMESLISQLSEHGVQINSTSQNKPLPLKISGKLCAGDYSFAGDVSSQYITGLLFALPLLEGNSLISITSKLESKDYVNITLAVLARFGINITKNKNSFSISGAQNYTTPCEITAEGDWSNAAFWLCAGAIIGTKERPIRVTGVSMNSLQGDKLICSILQEMGANLAYSTDSVTVYGGELHGVIIDASQIPDLIPVLSVVASLASGETKIINAARLRIKESDRLSAMAQNLSAIGALVQELPDGLIISGKASLSGGHAISYNDHRIAMSMAIASLRCEHPIEIDNPMCVSKSYPDFYDEFNALKQNF